MVIINFNLYVITNMTIENKHAHVKAEGGKLIVVNGINSYQESSDVYLALPCAGLDLDVYEYYGIAYAGKAEPGQGGVRRLSLSSIGIQTKYLTSSKHTFLNTSSK